jgi:asparagine synthase (glutamine-hydrolysing)
MCGIFSLLNSSGLSHNIIQNEFNKGKNRGPEFSKLDYSFMKLVLGFHRLAINGLNDESNQPFNINDVVLICNGEIYNYKQLYKVMGIEPKTQSDCEVIIHLYIKYGIEQTLNMLDGVYSFVLFDNRISEDLNNKIYVARDPYGVRPLYYLKTTDDTIYRYPLYGFASELKSLEYFYNINSDVHSIKQFIPGTYSVFNLSSKVSSIWEIETENKPYVIPSFSYSWLDTDEDFFTRNRNINIYSQIASYLNSAVDKRCLTTERPIACLLSGGLDSSLIASLVNNFYNLNNMNGKLETYSIGLENSEDLKYARIVADYLGTNHTEIIVTEKEMFDAIPEVIYAIESYDTTTVRASIGNYLLGKYISTHSEAKVIFNGDGSDELFGGYLYMNKCPDDIEFDRETRRLLKDIHTFDVLRSDKCISSHGLEPRTPFLDRSFVNFILSIPPSFRNHKNHDNACEKFILRNSFSKNYSTSFVDSKGRQILPDEILWRKKEAFSDGVSNQGRSLYQILQEKISDKLNLEQDIISFKPCIETEKYYYKQIFDKAFPNCDRIIPYFWMPKYTNASDPSARTLEFYSNNNTK